MIYRNTGRYTRNNLNAFVPTIESLPQVQKLNLQMSERDPLLQDRNSGQQLQQGEGQKGVGRALGPLEISRSTRYGILAGLWMATFLSVSLSFSSE